MGGAKINDRLCNCLIRLEVLSPGCGVGGAELSADGHLPADLDQMAAEDDECSLWRAEGAGMNPNFTSGSRYLFFPNQHRDLAGNCLSLLVSMMLA